jgi:hypothetical protein
MRCGVIGAVAAASLLLLFLPGDALAFGYEDATGFGTLLFGVSPSSVAFGGTRAVSLGDPTSVFLNPADLSRVSSAAFLACVGPGLGREIVDVSDGRSDRNYLDLGPVTAAFRINAGQRAGFAAGIARISDFTYEATQYIADDPFHEGEITYSESYESSGSLWEAAGGGGWRFMRWMSAGASLGLRFGGQTVEYIHDDWVGENDTLLTTSWDESALCAHLGLSAVFGLSSIGASYTTSTDKYPDVIAAGALLYSGGEDGGVIGVEGEVADLSDNQQFTAKLFGSISPDQSFDMRGSLFFGERGTQEERRSLLGFGLGVSVQVGKATIEGSFASSRSAREEGGAFGFEEDVEKVVDTVSLLTVGLGYTF